MKAPAYNITEISILLDHAISDLSPLTLDYTVDIVTEDRKLYTSDELMIIADKLEDTGNELKSILL